MVMLLEGRHLQFFVHKNFTLLVLVDVVLRTSEGMTLLYDVGECLCHSVLHSLVEKSPGEILPTSGGLLHMTEGNSHL